MSELPPDPERNAADNPPRWEAVEKLYLDHQTAARHAAGWILGSPRDPEIEDVIHNTVVKAYRAFHTLRNPEKAHGWFLTIVSRQALDHRRARSRRRRKESLAGSVEELQLTSRGLSPEEFQMLREGREFVDTLPENQRVAYLLEHFIGLNREGTGVLTEDCGHPSSSCTRQGQQKVPAGRRPDQRSTTRSAAKEHGMIIDKLLNLTRRARPAHQVPQALRNLDRAMLVAAVDEQQEAVTLAKARETVLADRAPSPSARPTSASHPKPTTREDSPWSRSSGSAMFGWTLLVGAVTVLTGVALIVWAPPEATTSVIISVAGWLSLVRIWLASRGSSPTRRASLLQVQSHRQSRVAVITSFLDRLVIRRGA
jgi:DNA-directed RNA polymerase specialized sigma24 family protein